MERSLRGSPVRVLSLWILLMASFDITGLNHGPVPLATAETLDAIKVSAVSGGDAILPCDTRLPQPTDVLLLVVWYKDDVPVYSFDGRAKESDAFWAEKVLLGRATWNLKSPSALRIQNVVASDKALYRCRVDFKVSPTKNRKILLDVVELPQKPKIFDEHDKEIVAIAGPYPEDASLKLTCVVSGGKPLPRVRWWRHDKVVSSLAPVEDTSNLSLLELKIPKLSREYLEAVYTCTADNTPLVPPLRVNVQIQLYLQPLQVEILPQEQPLSVGQPAEIACRAVGSRPPAAITWWLEGKQLTVVEQPKPTSDGNETISILHWTPRMEDDRRILTCRASHLFLKHSTIETSLTLYLHYMPIVNLQLGSKLNPNDIEEGDDVYFECVVRANPPPYKVVWEHNGQLMSHNQRAGVIAGAAHLALQGVSRQQAGNYVCSASNVEGDGRSSPVKLQIIYKPVCKQTTDAPIIVGVSLKEAIRVVCEVDAVPKPKNFQWILNNTIGTIELDSATFIIDSAGRSILTYTPHTMADYGSLACRATNLAGQQTDPCTFNLMPAVKPDAPSNCSAQNLTDDSVELQCFAGYDGGLQTTYVVEAWASGVLVANSSVTSPVWKLRGLGAGRALKMLFYAYNIMGRSDAVTLRIHTLSRLALYTGTKSKNGLAWAFGSMAGVGGLLVAIACLVLLLRNRRRHPTQYQAPVQNTKTFKGTTRNNCDSPVPSDDKNPDVVPLEKDYISTRGVELPPDPPQYETVVSPPVVSSRSTHSMLDTRSLTRTPNTPGSDIQSFGSLVEDRRSITSGTLTRRREIVTTRTPLLANTKESCV